MKTLIFKIFDKLKLAAIMEILLIPFTIVSVFWLKILRKSIIQKKSKVSKRIFMKLGCFPIIDHYYEPLFNYNSLKKPLREDRILKGIDFNINEQLNILNNFDYNSELLAIPAKQVSADRYFYNNGFYEAEDAEYLYNMIRLYKPKNIIEIGCGFSTLMIENAIRENELSNSSYKCEHICIEPYEASWLSHCNINVLKNKIEDVDKDIFLRLGKNDILFIDTSHIIRPQGDVLFLFLEILPLINSGVFVHIHDIFTPKDYQDNWLKDQHMFWNEQYLLEAFMCFNQEFRVIGSLNFLWNNYFSELNKKCPITNKNTDPYGPGSFWIIRN